MAYRIFTGSMRLDAEAIGKLWMILIVVVLYWKFTTRKVFMLKPTLVFAVKSRVIHI